MSNNTGTSQGLGFGNGSLIEYEDGTVEYRKAFTMLPAFKVAIADITGFSVRKVTKDDKKRLDASSLEQVLTVQGSGTTLAEVSVNYGTAEKIEEWFRNHPQFGTTSGPPQQAAGNLPQPGTFVDELVKLAQLRDAGALTLEEFEQAKHKLLNY